MWTLPNILTYLRIILIFPMIFCMLQFDHFWATLVATGIYAFATITDWFDGFLARKYNMGSDLGRALDPIADKLIVMAALVVLSYSKFSHWEVWATFLILFREILVSGFRESLADYNIKMPVSYIAKVKTTVQMFAIGGLILFNTFSPWYTVAQALLWVATILTLYTGFQYTKIALTTINKGTK